MGGLRLVLAVAVVAAPSLQSTTPERAADERPRWFVHNTWYQRHGLPENTIRTLVHDRDGYLWIATHAGVARFDGAHFTVFDERQRGQLPEMEVQALIEGDDGSIWLGTYGGGLVRYRDGGFQRFTSRDGLVSDFILSLSRDGQGGIWIGTDGGLSRMQGGRFRSYTTGDGLLRNGALFLHLDRDRSLWIAHSNGGVSRFEGGRFQPFAVPGLTDADTVRAVLRDRRQTLWFASYRGLVQLTDGQSRRYTMADGLASDRLYALHEDGDGNLWIGSDKGLNWFRDGRFGSIPAFAGRGFTAIGSHPEGCVWAGSGWLACLLRSQFENHSADDGLPHHYTTTFLEDRQKSLWIATITGLGRLRDGVVTAVPADRGLPGGEFTAALAQDQEGRLWVGTDVGLYRSLTPLDGERVEIPRFAPVPDQPMARLQSRGMLVDRAGTVWIATVRNGLMAFRDGRFTVYTTRDGLLDDVVRGLREDGAGNLWLGTRKGLQRFRDGKFTSFTVKEGLVDGSVDALHLDGDGALWIGTRQGVSRFQDGAFTTFNVNHGLPSSYVNAFVDDNAGNLWMPSIRGLFRIPRRELTDFAAGRRRSVSPVLYGTEHGLLSTRATASIDHSAYRTSDGRVWFATVRGASGLDPRRLQVNPHLPPAHIEEVRVDGRVLGPGPQLRAPPGRGDIAIQYTGIGFIAPDKLRFRYRLQGYDQEWLDAGNRRSAQYSNIPPGQYVFQMMAASAEGSWNPAVASLSMWLQPHWYQTWLFRAGAVLALILAAAGGYRRRVRALQWRQRELEERVAERTAALATANKELEAFGYSVSHDLRQPLRALEGFSRALIDREAGRLGAESRQLLEHMQTASGRMDRLIDDMFTLSRVRKMDVVRESVDLSAMAREIGGELQAAQPGRSVDLQVADGLKVDADPRLMRIALQNLLSNAWKFTGKVAQPRIEIGVTGGTEKDRVYFVRDNGAGFDQAYAGKLFTAFQRLHARSEFDGSGVGLATVARVIQRHGGRVWAEGAVGQGATFRFTIEPQE
jgi:ligand-binding sensor domain-containing protein/signal transduction histidine kinase